MHGWTAPLQQVASIVLSVQLCPWDLLGDSNGDLKTDTCSHLQQTENQKGRRGGSQGGDLRSCWQTTAELETLETWSPGLKLYHVDAWVPMEVFEGQGLKVVYSSL